MRKKYSKPIVRKMTPEESAKVETAYKKVRETTQKTKTKTA